jgi:PHD/YefM family antitoxin component YafN of YafNO toxin-antitoxin module
MIDFSNTHERYVTDEAGNRIGVILTLDEYSHLMDAAEELEAIRAFDEAKASKDEAIPFEQAISEIEQRRG